VRSDGRSGRLRALRSGLGAPASPVCAFCGKTAEQVAKMVVRASANICNDCAERAVGAIAERKAGSVAESISRVEIL
jgi:ribosome-binding protein aMBF1 (putative translation factor)